MRNALSFIGRLLALRLLCSYRDSELEKVISPTGSRQVHRVWELRQGTHRAASEGLVELPQRDSVSLSIVLSVFWLASPSSASLQLVVIPTNANLDW